MSELLPFGAESCESEIKLLKGAYKDYYFQHTPFNEEALRPEIYLFIGRRGAGKTSLAHFFTFQDKFAKAHCIDVDEPAVYEDVLTRVAKGCGPTAEIANTRIVAIWDYIIWSLIFSVFAPVDQVVQRAFHLSSPQCRATQLVKLLLQKFLDLFLKDQTSEISRDLEQLLVSPTFDEARKRVVELTREQPVFIAIDSLEKYSTGNEDMMRALSALVECSAKINTLYAGCGIHVKTFLSAEIFPHISETAISNYSKYVRHPVYLHWRPKDLVRLICWRLNEFFAQSPQYNAWHRPQVNWDDTRDVVTQVWNPVFGTTIRNGAGRDEETLWYILRHTQLRPRQAIILCNRIASDAQQQNCFPKIRGEVIINAVREQELELAREIINSYSAVYPKISDIVAALAGLPVKFSGNQLDKMGRRSASSWSAGDYSPTNFRRLVTELGIVGKVRTHREPEKIVLADFEYTLRDRLNVNENDHCVVHPMFFHKLNIDTSQNLIVYPFPGRRGPTPEERPTFD